MTSIAKQSVSNFKSVLNRSKCNNVLDKTRDFGAMESALAEGIPTQNRMRLRFYNNSFTVAIERVNRCAS